MKKLLTELRVSYFGMELNGIHALFGVLHSGARTVVGDRGNLKAFGSGGYIIGMAHPDDRFFGNAPEKLAVGSDVEFNLTVFGNGRGLNLAARHPRDKLTAVADAEHGNTELEYAS